VNEDGGSSLQFTLVLSFMNHEGMQIWVSDRLGVGLSFIEKVAMYNVEDSKSVVT
jgi:hypothetical protein